MSPTATTPDNDVQTSGESDGQMKRRRLQIELSELAYQRLIELVAESGEPNVAHFTRTALQLYARVLEEQRQGYRLQFVKDARQIEFLQVGSSAQEKFAVVGV